MPHPLLIVSHSDSLIQMFDINSHTEWQIVQIQISWLLQKPTDLDLHCLQRQGISGFSRTRVKFLSLLCFLQILTFLIVYSFRKDLVCSSANNVSQVIFLVNMADIQPRPASLNLFLICASYKYDVSYGRYFSEGA